MSEATAAPAAPAAPAPESNVKAFKQDDVAKVIDANGGISNVDKDRCVELCAAEFGFDPNAEAGVGTPISKVRRLWTNLHNASSKGPDSNGARRNGSNGGGSAKNWFDQAKQAVSGARRVISALDADGPSNERLGKILNAIRDAGGVDQVEQGLQLFAELDAVDDTDETEPSDD